MKILLVNDMAAPIGGAELITRALRRELKNRGHDARIFASRAESTPGTCFADYTCYGTTSGLRTLNRSINLDAMWQLRRVLTEFRPDVVHVRMFLTQLSPLILPLLQEIPSVYHASWYSAICPTGLKLLPDNSICQQRAGIACYRNGCLSVPAWSALMLQRRLLLRWLTAFDRIVANSTAVQRQLSQNGIGPVEVIWNGVPVRPARPPLAPPPTVCYAGRLSREKGVDILLQAFARMVDHMPQARLLIAGDGPERLALEALITELDLCNAVTMLGHLPPDEMERQLGPTWVQVVPSLLAEPFGLVTAEAMMRGTAVVASNIGGLPEIVVHGQTGLCVTPGAIDELAAAMHRLLSNRAEAEKMGSVGRQRACEYFSLSRFANSFVAVYESLIQGEATGRQK